MSRNEKAHGCAAYPFSLRQSDEFEKGANSAENIAPNCATSVATLTPRETLALSKLLAGVVLAFGAGK